MKKKIAAGLGAGALVLSGVAMAAPAQATPSCNWGQLTSSAIAGGFDQGEHASSYAGSPRVGLANVVNQGDLAATCTALS